VIYKEGVIIMVVFIINNGEEKVAETVNFRNAMDIYNKVNRSYGMNSASMWRYDTNDASPQLTRIGVSSSIHDNSIKRI
jgi:hypothetical protein